MVFKTRWVSNASKVLIFLLFLSSLIPAGVFADADSGAFSDTGKSYAQTEIAELAAAGIVSGYGDGQFRPKESVSRAELSKMIATAIKLPQNSDGAAAFRDVPANSWFRGYVGALVDAGIVQGVSADAFAPAAKVTREELAVLFVRALGLDETARQLEATAQLSDFADVSDWAKADVSLAYRIGFVKGIASDGGGFRFDPQASAERQAVALLTYQLMTGKDNYVAAAQSLAKDDSTPDDSAAAPAAAGAKAIDANTIEVAFSSALGAADVHKEDFILNGDLTVTNAALKEGNPTVVVLTTSAMVSGKPYKLSYKGKDTALSFTYTAAAPVFGGGGGYSGPSGPSVADLLASGKSQGTVVITASGTYGPESGPDTPVAHLTIDPGPTGEVTLRHIQPDVLEVLSGDVHSIKLLQTVIKQLRVNAVNNGGKDVRIEVQDGTNIENTEVESQAVLESATENGHFGSITLTSGAAGKNITLKGNIDSAVTVNAPGATIQLAPPSEGNPASTAIKSLVLSVNAKVNAAGGTKLTDVKVGGTNTSVQFGGQGSISNVTVDASASGTAISLDADANIGNIQADSDVNLSGSADTIANMQTSGAAPIRLDSSIQNAVKAKAVANAVQAIDEVGTFGSYTFDFQRTYAAAGSAVATAKSYGASDSDITNLAKFQAVRDEVDTVKLQVGSERESLAVGYAGGDTATSVLHDLVLKSVGDHGIAIVWTSDRPDIIAPSTGAVKRPALGSPDAEVALTASISLKGYTETKTFAVAVKALNDFSVTSVKRLSSNAVEVSFNQAVAAFEQQDFTFDHGLTVTRAIVMPDKPASVLLLTGPQAGSTIYTLSYLTENTGLSFTTPVSSGNHPPSASVDFIEFPMRLDYGPTEKFFWLLFNDADGNTVTVTDAVYNHDGLLNADLRTNSVLITPLAMGRSNIVLTASDGKDGLTTLVFQVDIAPEAPVLQSVVAGDHQATLTWLPVDGATSYTIGYYTDNPSPDPSGPPTPHFLTLVPVDADLSTDPIVYTLTGLMYGGSNYMFAVYPLHGLAQGAPSNPISAVIQGSPFKP